MEVLKKRGTDETVEEAGGSMSTFDENKENETMPIVTKKRRIQPVLVQVNTNTITVTSTPDTKPTVTSTPNTKITNTTEQLESTAMAIESTATPYINNTATTTETTVTPNNSQTLTNTSFSKSKRKGTDKKEQKRLKEQEKEELRKQKEQEKEELRKQKEAEKEKLKKQKELEKEESRKQKELEKEEQRKQKEAEKEELRKQRELEKEELRKQKEAEKEELKRQKEQEKEELRKLKEMEKEEQRKQKEQEKLKALSKQRSILGFVNLYKNDSANSTTVTHSTTNTNTATLSDFDQTFQVLPKRPHVTIYEPSRNIISVEDVVRHWQSNKQKSKAKERGSATTNNNTSNTTTAIKLIQFSENVRPPFFGLLTKLPPTIRLRNPFWQCKELQYDFESEAEWEEDDGEDCLSDDQSDVHEEEEEEEDGWMVPHGYLSDDEGLETDRDVEERKDAPPQQQPRFQGVLKINGPCFERKDCWFMFDVVLLRGETVIDLQQTDTVDLPVGTPAAVMSTPNATGRLSVFPNEALPALIKVVHQSPLGMDKLIDTAKTVDAMKLLSKASIERKIKEISRREKGGRLVLSEFLTGLNDEAVTGADVNGTPTVSTVVAATDSVVHTPTSCTTATVE